MNFEAVTFAEVQIPWQHFSKELITHIDKLGTELKPLLYGAKVKIHGFGEQHGDAVIKIEADRGVQIGLQQQLMFVGVLGTILQRAGLGAHRRNILGRFYNSSHVIN